MFTPFLQCLRLFICKHTRPPRPAKPGHFCASLTWSPISPRIRDLRRAKRLNRCASDLADVSDTVEARRRK